MVLFRRRDKLHFSPLDVTWSDGSALVRLQLSE